MENVNYFQDVNNCLAILIQSVEMMRRDVSEIKKKTLYTKVEKEFINSRSFNFEIRKEYTLSEIPKIINFYTNEKSLKIKNIRYIVFNIYQR